MSELAMDRIKEKCIQFLENKYKVVYDAQYAKRLKVSEGTLKNMWSGNHHLVSLGHAPDFVGLLFSILDQFAGRASFIDNGQLIRAVPLENGQTELRGNNPIAKLFCGFANWLGHIISDCAGSNSTKAITDNHEEYTRGSGIPIPLFELFQFCEFGSIDSNGERMTFADFSVKVFEQGYDARMGVAMAIPVTINELLVRLAWSVKRKFYHKCSWKESIPIGNQPELRRMLLVGHGVLCLVDGADATINGVYRQNILSFATRINIVAWKRLALSGLLEIRALYNEQSLDIHVMEKDIESEWNRLEKLAT